MRLDIGETESNKGSRANSDSVSPTRDFEYTFDKDPDDQPQVWASRHEQGVPFDAEQSLDVAMGEFKSQVSRVVAQNRPEGSSASADLRIAPHR